MSAIEAIKELAAESRRQADFHGSDAHRSTICTEAGEAECRAYEEMYDDYARTLTEIIEATA